MHYTGPTRPGGRRRLPTVQAPMHSKTTINKVLAVILVNLVVLEAISFGAVHALGLVSPNRRLDLFVDGQLANLTDETLATYLASSYDRELGWNSVPGTAVTQKNVRGEAWTATYDNRGARVSCLGAEATHDAPPLVATFGDSFTRGDEVADHETWQCELERRLGQRVVNHGVGGYDVTQAVLKAQREWSEGRIAPVTVLGVYADDLSRVLGRYRPYQDGSSAANLGFKPSYRRLDGTVVFLPNPLRPDVASVGEVRALALAVAPTDYWAQGWARVLPEFPYSLQLARTGKYLVGSALGTPHYSVNIWNTTEGREVMLTLLNEFVASASHHSTRAVLLLIPDVNDWSDGRLPADYAEFARGPLAAAGLDLIVADVADATFAADRFSIKPFEGHASAYGNTVVADALLRALEPLLATVRTETQHP